MLLSIEADLDDDMAAEVAEVLAGLEAMLACWAEFERLYGV